MLSEPLEAVMRVPPRRKTEEAMIIVFLRPILSAKGKANKAPKKQPAYTRSVAERKIHHRFILTWKVDTMLP
jgi:hypothetical protein